MITAVLAVDAVLILALAGLLLRQGRSSLARRLKCRVLVTLKSGASFDGVLYSADRQLWVLRSAQAVGAGDNGATIPADGEILILTSDIDFAQKP